MIVENEDKFLDRQLQLYNFMSPDSRLRIGSTNKEKYAELEKYFPSGSKAAIIEH